MNWTFRKQVSGKGTHLVASTQLDELAGFVDHKTINALVNKLVDLWVEEYGAELLKTISPDLVKTIVEQKIADRFFR